MGLEMMTIFRDSQHILDQEVSEWGWGRVPG